MKKLFFISAVLLSLPLVLVGCSTETKKRLGLGRQSPDEFSVVERAPLSVPPNFNLRPPAPGAARPQEQTPKQTAQNLVLRSVSSAPSAVDVAKPNVTSGQAALLQQAGAPQADANIRAKLAAEVGQDDKGPPQTVAEKVGLKAPAEPGKALDPVAEKAKLEAKKIKTPAVVLTKPATKSKQ